MTTHPDGSTPHMDRHNHANGDGDESLRTVGENDRQNAGELEQSSSSDSAAASATRLSTENDEVPGSAQPRANSAITPNSDPVDVVVLAGGISHERDVSLRSGRRVAELLKSAGHSVRLEEPSGAVLNSDASPRPVYWISLHGASGEEGTLQSLFDLRGIPYVGAQAAAASLTWSKPTAKSVVSAIEVATPEWITLSRSAFRELGAADVVKTIHETFTLPVVVKPESGGSAQGLTVVEQPEYLVGALVDALTYTEKVLIERYISGIELAVTIVDTNDGPRALPPVEVSPVSGHYSFEARYNAGETVFYTPARCTPEVSERAGQAALAAYDVLGLRDLARIDLIIDADGTPWFLEANTIPGTTETSLVPLAIRASGATEATVYSDSVSRAASRSAS